MKFSFYYKQLLDEVFVISRIIKFEIGAISPETATLIILHITKTEYSNVLLYIEREKMDVVFLLLH